MKHLSLREDLEAVIRYWHLEEGSKTPDTVLSNYLLKCLEAWNDTVQMREGWYLDDEGRTITAQWTRDEQGRRIILSGHPSDDIWD